jgi:hypothetical protein
MQLLMLRCLSIVALALLAAASGASAAGQFVIVAPVEVPSAVYRTVQAAAVRCLSLYEDYLRTHRPKEFTIHLYTTPDAFVRGHVTVGRHNPHDARRAAGNLASSIGHNILINVAVLQSPASLTGTTCHEILHVYQYALGAEGTRPVHEWMIEGYAYLMEKIALDRLGLESLSLARGRAVRLLKASSTHGMFPRLTEMSTSEQFGRVGERTEGLLPHYLILAMDFLLSKTSHSAFVAYFKSFAPGAGTASMDESFRAAFNMTTAEFQVKLDAYMAATTR